MPPPGFDAARSIACSICRFSTRAAADPGSGFRSDFHRESLGRLPHREEGFGEGLRERPRGRVLAKRRLEGGNGSPSFFIAYWMAAVSMATAIRSPSTVGGEGDDRIASAASGSRSSRWARARAIRASQMPGAASAKAFEKPRSLWNSFCSIRKRARRRNASAAGGTAPAPRAPMPRLRRAFRWGSGSARRGAERIEAPGAAKKVWLAREVRERLRGARRRIAIPTIHECPPRRRRAAAPARSGCRGRAIRRRATGRSAGGGS